MPLQLENVVDTDLELHEDAALENDIQKLLLRLLGVKERKVGHSLKD